MIKNCSLDILVQIAFEVFSNKPTSTLNCQPTFSFTLKKLQKVKKSKSLHKCSTISSWKLNFLINIVNMLFIKRQKNTIFSISKCLYLQNILFIKFRRKFTKVAWLESIGLGLTIFQWPNNLELLTNWWDFIWWITLLSKFDSEKVII